MTLPIIRARSSDAATKLFAVAGLMTLPLLAATDRSDSRFLATGTSEESKPLGMRELTTSGTDGLETPGAACAAFLVASSTTLQASNTAPAGLLEAFADASAISDEEAGAPAPVPSTALVVLAAESACPCSTTFVVPTATSL